MAANAQRTSPENHALYYVEDEAGLVFLTHDMKENYRLIETWHHEDTLQERTEALKPFAYALRFARERLGHMPDKSDVTALALRWISYDHLKAASASFSAHKPDPE